jgi:PAS domain-containing protein
MKNYPISRWQSGPMQWVALAMGLGAYIVGFLALYPFVGLSATTLALLPAVVAGLSSGRTFGLIVSVFLFPLNLLLALLLGADIGILFGGGSISGHLLTVLVGGMTGYMRDLKVRAELELARVRELEHERSRLERIIENTDDLVILLDAAGRIAYRNQTATQRLASKTGSAETALEWRDLLPNEARVDAYATLEHVATGQRWEGILRLMPEVGTTPLSTTAKLFHLPPMRASDQPMIAVIAREEVGLDALEEQLEECRNESAVLMRSIAEREEKLMQLRTKLKSQPKSR